MIMAKAVMMTGRKRVVPGFDRGRDRIAVMEQPLLGESHDENAVGRGHAHAHDGSHQCGNAERGVGDEEKQNDTGQRRGQRSNDDERVKPGLEIHHDQQVHQDDRKAQPTDQADIRSAHRAVLAADRNEASARKRLPIRVDDSA